MPIYPYHKKNLAPRFSLAWSPSWDSGWLSKLTGGPGRTSIRAGFGMFYDQLGHPIIAYLSQAASFGLSSSITNSAGTLSSITAPRFTSPFDLPAQLIPPAPKGGLPQEAPRNQALINNIDQGLRYPYSMNMNLSVGREFGGGLFVQAAYVGRLARSSLLNRDLALHTDMKDPASGVTYIQAARQMLGLWRSNVPVAQVGPIPYWENMWPGAAGGGLTATQAVYNKFSAYNVDTSAVTYDMDINCDPSCSKFGPFALFNEQVATYNNYTSDGRGNYHAMQWTVRKRLGNDLRFDFNYTWSKSIDLNSNTARNDRGPAAQLGPERDQGPIGLRCDPCGQYVCDLGTARRKRQAVPWLSSGGGSGDPGRVAVERKLVPVQRASGRRKQRERLAHQLGPAPYATQISQPVQQTTKNAPAIVGESGPNIFPDPTVGRESFEFTLIGSSGSRNSLRGDGMFIDQHRRGEAIHHALQRRALHSIPVGDVQHDE